MKALTVLQYHSYYGIVTLHVVTVHVISIIMSFVHSHVCDASMSVCHKELAARAAQRVTVHDPCGHAWPRLGVLYQLPQAEELPIFIRDEKQLPGSRGKSKSMVDNQWLVVVIMMVQNRVNSGYNDG